MENQRVHEYTIATGEGGLPVARIGRIHNLITFVREGSAKLHYLDGRWLDDGKNPIAEADVPEECIRAVGEVKFTPAHESGADVLIHCEFCPTDQPMPSRDYAKHLATVHIRRQAEPEAEVEAKPQTEVEAAEPVVYNKNGSVRKKAGRPRKET